LGRIQDEIKCLGSTDSPGNCDSFASHHRCPKYLCPARLEREDISRFPSPSRSREARRPIRTFACPRTRAGKHTGSYASRLALAKPLEL
jgi:hypothetical protein